MKQKKIKRLIADIRQGPPGPPGPQGMTGTCGPAGPPTDFSRYVSVNMFDELLGRVEALEVTVAKRLRK